MLYKVFIGIKMNINIYLEDGLGKQINQVVEISGKTRNAIIREAIKEWLEHHQVKQWPASILKFKGIPDIEPFESGRDELLPPKEDPFA